MASRAQLNSRHEALEQQLAAELKRPMPDPILLQRIKREKLALKEQLTEC